MIPDTLKKGSTETAQQYIERVLLLKVANEIKLTWSQVTDLISSSTGVVRSTVAWKHRAYRLHKRVTQGMSSPSELEVISQVNAVIQELRKERVKTSDERTQLRSYIRRIAREESLIEIAQHAVNAMSSKKILPTEIPEFISESTNEAILQISDWHYGIEVNNHWNKFNPKICVERVAHLRDEVIDFCKQFKVQRLHVVNLSDLIAGRIHSTIRFESRCDVISQIMNVAEILAEFLTDIVLITGVKIDYYDCLDNHSRLEPVKTESLDLESLARIIPWYLKLRLVDYDIVIHKNEISDDIITFTVFDGKYKVAGVHGHKDKPNKIVNGLTLMTQVHYDLILTAHLHHFSADEKNETLVLSNGSLMGTDTYAKDLRLSAKASQNIILVTEKSVLADIRRIQLN